jgi:hypothetical protein
MLLKKLSTIGVAVVASLTLATSAAVVARQATSARRGDQTSRQIVRGSVGVEGVPNDASRSTASIQRAPKEDKEDTADRIELLRLDIELLAAEVQALKEMIAATSSQLISTHVPGQRDREEIEELRAVLDAARKEYITKQREFSRKRAELSELETSPPLGANSPFGSEKAVNNRSAGRKAPAIERVIQIEVEAGKSPPINPMGNPSKYYRRGPAASPNPEISPILEKRLSGIEQKLDEVLKALTALTHEIRD